MHASDLGIRLAVRSPQSAVRSPQSLYRWLVASMLFGRPVQQQILTDELHDAMRTVVDRYGSVSRLVRTSGSRAELSERLQEMKGIGAKTVEIFLRDIPDSVM